MFGNPNEKDDIHQALLSLQQTKAVNTYTVKFRELSLKIEQNKEAYKTLFIRGLKTDIQAEFLLKDTNEITL